MKRYLSLFLGDELLGHQTAATTTLGVPDVPDGAFILSSWLDPAERFIPNPSAGATWEPVTATMDDAGSGPDVVFAAAVERARALKCSTAVRGDTWHAIKIQQPSAMMTPDALPPISTFAPTGGTNSAWAQLIAQVDDAVASLRLMGGEIILDRVYWVSAGVAGSNRPSAQDLQDEAKDLRLFLRSIGQHLQLEGDKLPPLSTVFFPATPEVNGQEYDMNEHLQQVAVTLENYPRSGVTDTRDYARTDDLRWTGDSTLELGRSMSQTPSLTLGGPVVGLGA